MGKRRHTKNKKRKMIGGVTGYDDSLHYESCTDCGLPTLAGHNKCSECSRLNFTKSLEIQTGLTLKYYDPWTGTFKDGFFKIHDGKMSVSERFNKPTMYSMELSEYRMRNSNKANQYGDGKYTRSSLIVLENKKSLIKPLTKWVIHDPEGALCEALKKLKNVRGDELVEGSARTQCSGKTSSDKTPGQDVSDSQTSSVSDVVGDGSPTSLESVRGGANIKSKRRKSSKKRKSSNKRKYTKRR